MYNRRSRKSYKVPCVPFNLPCSEIKTRKPRRKYLDFHLRPSSLRYQYWTTVVIHLTSSVNKYYITYSISHRSVHRNICILVFQSLGQSTTPIYRFNGLLVFSSRSLKMFTLGSFRFVPYRTFEDILHPFLSIITQYNCSGRLRQRKPGSFSGAFLQSHPQTCRFLRHHLFVFLSLSLYSTSPFHIHPIPHLKSSQNRFFFVSSTTHALHTPYTYAPLHELFRLISFFSYQDVSFHSLFVFTKR